MEQTLKKSLKVSLIFLAIGLMLGALIVFAATPSSTFYISSGIYPGAPSYTVWKEGSNYFAKDATGQIDYSGTNASLIIQNAMDGLTVGRTWKETILLKGDFTLDTYITPSSYTVLRIDGILTLADNTDTNIIRVATNIRYFDVYGGILDGNKNGQTPASKGTAYAAILLKNAKNVTIKDVTIKNSNGDAMNIFGDGDYCENVKIQNNIIDNCWEGILLQRAKRCVISENIITNIWEQDGIEPSNYAYQIIVSDNIINGTYQSGIELYNYVYYCTVDSNTVIDCGTGNSECGIVAGNEAHYNIISNNFYDGPDKSEYSAFRCSGGASHNKFVDNIVYRAYRGYEDWDGDYNEVLFNTFNDITHGALIVNNLASNATLIGNIAYSGYWDLAAGSVRQFHQNYVEYGNRRWSENTGNATISSSTSVTFYHYLYNVPTLVLASFDSTGCGVYTWSATQSQITITVVNTGTYEVYWYAEYKP